MATSDSYGQTRVMVRGQSGAGPTTYAELAASGGTVGGNGIFDFTSGTLKLPGALAIGYLDLNTQLFNARSTKGSSGESLTSGSTAEAEFFQGVLGPAGVPAINLLSSANRIMSMIWASNTVPPIILPPINIPQDLATAGGLTIQLYGEITGTASAADVIDAVQIIARFATVTTATNADVGSTHPNFTSSPTWKGITIASGSVATAPLTLILTPQAHAACPINIYGMRASYTLKTS